MNETTELTGTKPWYESKTYIRSIAAIISNLAGMGGVAVAVDQLADALGIFIALTVALVAQLGAIMGRKAATQRIK